MSDPKASWMAGLGVTSVCGGGDGDNGGSQSQPGDQSPTPGQGSQQATSDPGGAAVDPSSGDYKQGYQDAFGGGSWAGVPRDGSALDDYNAGFAEGQKEQQAQAQQPAPLQAQAPPSQPPPQAARLPSKQELYQQGYQTGLAGGIGKCFDDPDADAAYNDGYQAGVAAAKNGDPDDGQAIRPPTDEENEYAERREKLLREIELKENAREVLDELGNDPKVLEDREIQEAVAQWQELQEMLNEREGIEPEPEMEAE